MKKMIKFYRIGKKVIFKMNLGRLVPSKMFEYFAYMGKLSKWIKKHPTANYIDNKGTFDYSKRYDLYNHLIQEHKLDTNIDYFEFGVATGTSFRWWLSKIKNSDARFYGFDTFSGLPEDWGPFKKGEMHNNCEKPVIDGNRHEFYQGLFQQTLEPFLKSYNSNNRKVILMDADIYTASLYVLTTINSALNPGDIIIFDEFNVPMHEFKAFTEWTNTFYIKYDVLGFVNNYYAIAFMIK